ncbi:hypothetical protein [Pinibacter aurantiacus]|uniref:Uncharacterized protein n=1 Tax=Pinibacter aurantiacus TaxID=2851599 RepID=A0A9E2S9B4_9BACT|nr:hypothetical protein [Pinibacter aurantiacus]MBV4357268.1 hypothetical protein [Pinibacter aurantiacus]
MKSYFFIIAWMTLSFFAQGQDVKPAADTTVKPLADTLAKPVVDTAALAKHTADSLAAVKASQNCYTKWYDFMRTHGAKPVPDGMQKVVITFKSGESCHCFMGKIEIVGGKIKPPLYVQEENGDYKTSTELGKKLDPEFVTSIGADLWKISDGMSALFRTTDQEYGRIFFYEFANKGKSTKKVAPSPEELIKPD